MMLSPEYARAWMAPHNQPTLSAFLLLRQVSAFQASKKLVLQNGEIRCSVGGGRYHHFAVDDRRSGVYVPSVGCDFSETVGPVVAAPGEHLDHGILKMDLDSIAVELNLVNPALARGHLVDRGRQGRGMKPR